MMSPQKDMRPSKAGLKAVAEFPEPTNYTKIRAFLGLVGNYSPIFQRLFKDSMAIVCLSGRRWCHQEERSLFLITES